MSNVELMVPMIKASWRIHENMAMLIRLNSVPERGQDWVAADFLPARQIERMLILNFGY